MGRIKDLLPEQRDPVDDLLRVEPDSTALVAAAYRYGREQLGLTAAQAMRRARLRYELSCPCAGHRQHVEAPADARAVLRY
jgi:hypothetical protein